MCTNVCKPFKNKYLTRYIYWVRETAVLTSMKKPGVHHRLQIPRISSAACWPAQIKGLSQCRCTAFGKPKSEMTGVAIEPSVRPCAAQNQLGFVFKLKSQA
jgi:hypothetical protein